MNKREKFVKEIAEVINRNSLEGNFNDTPDYILASVAVAAMEAFADASKVRDDWHGFKKADNRTEKPTEEKPSCKGCPLTSVCPAVKMEPQPERKKEYKKPEAFDVPKKVQAMADFFGEMFPGTEVEIHRIEPRRNPRDKRRAKNKRNNRKGKTI